MCFKCTRDAAFSLTDRRPVRNVYDTYTQRDREAAEGTTMASSCCSCSCGSSPVGAPAGICLFASFAVCASCCRSVCSLAVCFVCFNRVYYMPLRVLPHATWQCKGGGRITLKLSPQKLHRFLFINFNCFNKKNKNNN